MVTARVLIRQHVSTWFTKAETIYNDIFAVNRFTSYWTDILVKIHDLHLKMKHIKSLHLFVTILAVVTLVV